MIDLRLGPDEEMIRESARAFAQQRLLPGMRAREARAEVPVDIVRAYRALGFAAMEAPENFGGQAATPLAKAIVLEELGAADAGAAFALEGAGPALQALVELDQGELCRRIADEPATRVALVVDAAGRLEVRDGIVSGLHPWVPVPNDGCTAVVIVRNERILLVRSGVRVTPVTPLGLAAAGSSQLEFDVSPVAAETTDAAAIARALAHARLFVAALLVGVARSATDYAMRYAQERIAFGRPIAHHQGLAFLLAEMATSVEVMRLLVWRAAVALGQGRGAHEAAWALAEAAEQALWIGPSAVQVLGGHGFMKDHPVEKWMREIRTLAQLAGGRDEAELAGAAHEVEAL